MSGLTGHSTVGVGKDIVDYLTAVAQYFGVEIRVTSGFRSPDGQAQAMFDNWVDLKHGKVYKTTTLPPTDRDTLDADWVAAQNQKSSHQVRAKAKADFLKLARSKVGTKSRHSQGRAVDVSREHINSHIYQAITLRLHEVKEGTRTDIFHFESVGAVPAVDDAMKAKWQTIKNSPFGTSHGHPHHEHAKHGHPKHSHAHHGHHGCC